MPEGVNEPYAQEIGRAIAHARQERGMTQAALSERVGRSKNAVSNWERGASAPTVENLKALCQVLRVEPEVLMAMTGDSSGRLRNEKLFRPPAEEIRARVNSLRRDAAGSLPGLIEGLKDLEAEAERLRDLLS